MADTGTMRTPAPDFRALFEALPGPYLILLPNDPAFTIVAASNAYLEATLTKREEIVGRGIFEVFPDNPEDRAATGVENLRASFGVVLATKEKHAMPVQKYDIRTPDGKYEERYWSLQSSPFLGANGQVEFIIHRVEDVTELVLLRRREAAQGRLADEFRIRADEMEAELFLRAHQLSESQRLIREQEETEARLRASEARFSLAFAQAPIGMVLLTPDGKVTDANEAFVSTLGYTREELISSDSGFYTHPGDRELTQNFFRALREGLISSGSIEKRYFRRNGEMLWGRASAAMRRDENNRPEQVIAIVEDITDRKQAEARYRFLAESIPQMVWTADPDGSVNYVNGRATAYYGVASEQIIGEGWIEKTHPEDRERATAVWQRCLSTGELYEVSVRLLRADRTWRLHLVRAAPLRDESGNVTQWFGTCTDIEEQSQADARLRQQWVNFDTALSHTPDLVFNFDLAGRFTYANKVLLDLWQLPLDQAVGKTPRDLGYPTALADRLRRQVQQVVDTREPVTDQTPFTDKEGVTREFEYTLVPVFDGERKVGAAAGTAHDITERSRAANQIEEDRRRWREILVQAPAAIAILTGPAFIFRWVNEEYARLVGRDVVFLTGKTLTQALPEIESQAYVPVLQEVMRSGEPFRGNEALVRLQRGHQAVDVYLNFVFFPVKGVDGNVESVFVLAVDVTDTVVARKRIEESERQFRTLAETIPHLCWMADETGHIFWYNRRWYQYTGTTFKDMEGWGWRKAHDPATLPTVLEGWKQAIRTGEPFEMIFPLRSASGAFGSFLTRVEPVRDSTGRVVRWFGTNTDITDQRRTEEELRRMNRELEEFAYVASHDLQEPLRMVNIYTELLLRNRSADSDKLEQYSRFVHEGVRRMELLIQDLLTFSRTVHVQDAEFGDADLQAALDDALVVLRRRIDEAGALVVAERLPFVRGDVAQLSHVFQNILSNSIKYRKSGERPEIRVSAERQGSEWIVTVADNGIGFEAEYAERIFGLFKRLHKEEYPGTGLGLAICKRIVERYGGRIWAESRLDEGATFRFALPAAIGE